MGSDQVVSVLRLKRTYAKFTPPSERGSAGVLTCTNAFPARASTTQSHDQPKPDEGAR